MSSETRSRNRLNERVSVLAVKMSQRNENGDNIESNRNGKRVSSKSTPNKNRVFRPFSSNKPVTRIYPDSDSDSDSDSGGVVRVKDSTRTKWGLANSKENQRSQRKFNSTPDNNRKDRPFSANKQGKRIGRDLDSRPNGVVIAKDSSRTMWGLVNSKEKLRSETKFDSCKSQSPGVSSQEGLGKRMVHEKKKKKRFGEDRDEGLDVKPIKTKRVIRIDCNDVSNKRLDDGIGADNVPDNKKGKRGEPEEKLEISKNAQFRAIQPSSSILSYVEDNLLGRRRLIELQRAGYNTELSAPLDNVPNSTSPERERIEENVFRNKLEFFAAAKVSSSFPPPEFPEIAFAGRSNVGKSSLLNSLTRQWGVVRTSDKPGLTQTINFFDLGSKLSLVDLPGYGFAYAKEEVKDAWEELVKEYVSTRAGLKRVCLLIDTKWGMKPRDHELIDLMERAQTKYHIVLTKTDVVFPVDVARRAMQIEESLKAHKSIVQPVMMVSSKSGAGIRSLRTVLAKIGRFAKL